VENSQTTVAAIRPGILLANEPRSYRQAIAGVLRALHPGLVVAETKQATLDRTLRRGIPQLVICSRATPSVQRDAPAWIELYTDHGPLSFVAVGRENSTVRGMELHDILRIVDRVLAR
jgi:hypothetical protein